MTDDIETPLVRPNPREAYSAPGRPAQHAFAAMYQGEYETPWDGTAVAVRAHARALAAAGIPVLLKSFSNCLVDQDGIRQPVHQVGLPDSVQAEIGHLTKTSARQFFPRILHLVVRDAEHLKRVVMPMGAVPMVDSAGGGMEKELGMRQQIFDSTIVYSVWERDRVDPAIARTLSRVAECWVPSQGNRDMLISSGVPAEKVFVVPHPFDLESDILKLRNRKPTTDRRFYSIGRWEPRKAYAELVEAFLRAFKPEDNATLTIKYTGGNWPNYPTPDQVIYWCTHDRELLDRGWTREAFSKKVRLYEGRFPRAEILRLHFQNNIYVSSSRGEAWCLPAFEAKIAGNRLLTTRTGAMDFASDGDALLGSAFATSVPPSYGWESDAQWLGFRTDDLTASLASVTPPDLHMMDGGDMSRFRLESVGALMKERVLAVAQKHTEVLKAWGAT